MINDILDLSKIESGKMDVEVGSVRYSEVRDFCLRTFRHVADGKGLDFSIELEEACPPTPSSPMPSVCSRCLKNLLSNALKFTEHGTVRLRVERASSGWSPNHPVLNRVNRSSHSP